MRLIAFIIIACCILYLFKEYNDLTRYRQFKTVKFLSLRKVQNVYLKYHKVKNHFYIESEDGKILFYGTYKQCIKYLKEEKYEEEV